MFGFLPQHIGNGRIKLAPARRRGWFRFWFGFRFRLVGLPFLIRQGAFQLFGQFDIVVGMGLEPGIAAVRTLHVAPGFRDHVIRNFILSAAIWANQPHE